MIFLWQNEKVNKSYLIYQILVRIIFHLKGYSYLVELKKKANACPHVATKIILCMHSLKVCLERYMEHSEKFNKRTRVSLKRELDIYNLFLLKIKK